MKDLLCTRICAKYFSCIISLFCPASLSIDIFNTKKINFQRSNVLRSQSCQWKSYKSKWDVLSLHLLILAIICSSVLNHNSYSWSSFLKLLSTCNYSSVPRKKWRDTKIHKDMHTLFLSCSQRSLSSFSLYIIYLIYIIVPKQHQLWNYTNTELLFSLQHLVRWYKRFRHIGNIFPELKESITQLGW